jgi:hypothetical protein
VIPSFFIRYSRVVGFTARMRAAPPSTRTDFNYWYGGRISVNGEEHTQTLESNSRIGVTASVPVSRRQSLKISYSDGVGVRFGGKFKTLSVGRQYGWFGAPF